MCTYLALYTGALAAIGALLLGIIFLGVYPAPLLDAIQHASDAILSAQSVFHLAAIGAGP